MMTNKENLEFVSRELERIQSELPDLDIMGTISIFEEFFKEQRDTEILALNITQHKGTIYWEILAGGQDLDTLIYNYMEDATKVYKEDLRIRRNGHNLYLVTLTYM